MLALVPVIDPVLLGKAEPVVFPSASLNQTYADMLLLMMQQQALGLAAPQVGIPLRMFTYRVGKSIGLVVNPTILSRSAETVEGKEGCLSLPDQLFTVTRSNTIDVTYQDIAGNSTTRSLSGLMAVVFQHEIDHLDGVLICQIGQRGQ